jgi:hypothetical protein
MYTDKENHSGRAVNMIKIDFILEHFAIGVKRS